jgi:hypothetical protein
MPDRDYLRTGRVSLVEQPEEPLMSNVIINRRPLPLLLLLAAVIGLMLAGTIALWAHYGTTVFFEMIRTGLAACFG